MGINAVGAEASFAGAWQDVSLMFWVEFAFFLTGTIAFLGLTIRLEEERRKFHYLAFFMGVLGTFTYFYMAMGEGEMTNGDGNTIFIAHHIFRIGMTSLAIQTICMLACSPLPMTCLLHGLNLMHVCVLGIGALSSRPNKWAWFSFATIFYVALWWIVYFKQRPIAKNQHMYVEGLHRYLCFVSVNSWTYYWVLWIVGSSGKHLLGDDVECLINFLLDFWSVAVFGYAVTHNSEILARVDPADGLPVSRPPMKRSGSINEKEEGSTPAPAAGRRVAARPAQGGRPVSRPPPRRPTHEEESDEEPSPPAAGQRRLPPRPPGSLSGRRFERKEEE